MPEGAKLVGTVTDGKGLVVNVYATQVGNDVVFNVKVESGRADLRGSICAAFSWIPMTTSPTTRWSRSAAVTTT